MLVPTSLIICSLTGVATSMLDYCLSETSWLVHVSTARCSTKNYLSCTMYLCVLHYSYNKQPLFTNTAFNSCCL